MAVTVLIIEAEVILARSMKQSLDGQGYEVVAEGSAQAALETLPRVGPDLILVDLQFPGLSGMDCLRTLRTRGQDTPVLVVSAPGAVQNAVETIRLGAYDYITKPVDLDELKLVVARAFDHAKLSHELPCSLDRNRRDSPRGLPLGNCPEMRDVQERIQQIARLERPPGDGAPSILVLGETGTGKGLVARTIHRLCPRSAHPFIEVNCSALPDTLLEAELFGYEKGAFTDARSTRPGLFEAADRGTLFLDEVGHLNLSAQTKLLKVIEEKTFRRLGSTAQRHVDVRIIAATSRDLASAQASGTFLPELYHRLSVLTIELPPLRQRGDDLMMLAEHFVKHHAEQYRLPLRRLSAGARQILGTYHWPGNVRELINEMERAMLLETGEEEITLGHLAKSVRALPPRPVLSPGGSGGIAVELPQGGIAFETIERQVLVRALQLTGWNVAQAARFLNLSRDRLRYRMKRLNIDQPASA